VVIYQARGRPGALASGGGGSLPKISETLIALAGAQADATFLGRLLESALGRRMPTQRCSCKGERVSATSGFVSLRTSACEQGHDSIARDVDETRT